MCLFARQNSPPGASRYCLLQKSMLLARSSNRSMAALTSAMTIRSLTFWRLPRELQLAVLEQLSFRDYVTFALSAYYNLRYSFPAYFPPLTRSRLRWMRARPPTGADPLQDLPNEMIINIARYVEPRGLLRWVIAHYYTLARSNPPLVPPLDAENMQQLYSTWLRLDNGW